MGKVGWSDEEHVDVCDSGVVLDSRGRRGGFDVNNHHRFPVGSLRVVTEGFGETPPALSAPGQATFSSRPVLRRLHGLLCCGGGIHPWNLNPVSTGVEKAKNHRRLVCADPGNGSHTMQLTGPTQTFDITNLERPVFAVEYEEVPTLHSDELGKGRVRLTHEASVYGLAVAELLLG